MKLTTLVTGLLATTASAAFDKWQPWGKRDYSCINVYQGIPENATLAAGTTVQIAFNRDSDRCDAVLDQYAAGNYSVWLYNNPNRNLGDLSYDAQAKVVDRIPGTAKNVTVTIPATLPKVKDDSNWYLRLDTVLVNAPQMPSLFNAQGPFRIVR
ncbi:hypothetical protein ASPVEDRAFT_191099 [Aspergillus versicolor CBS 583.65]|uniref:Uncharacterized protein n=1 Tax=Aspergillus versicolor CBS 583.65 TaxID=1036611 RepID=A0A1L9PIH7_ASPVE|nr:uncharacterized protein ASPVEDRAFT_191099 [Aspergillus versicolor CBS 583.65]OJJ01302.1 hypothetical protein ASPVEDRAFT_191099 [Aspergillus versicolor CBS 583.65]